MQQDPEAIAIAALGFIAGDEQLLPRFLSLTGIHADQIRAAAKETGFLAGVLHFVLAHEPTLDKFCGFSGIEAQSVQKAHFILGGGNERYEVSV